MGKGRRRISARDKNLAKQDKKQVKIPKTKSAISSDKVSTAASVRRLLRRRCLLDSFSSGPSHLMGQKKPKKSSPSKLSRSQKSGPRNHKPSTSSSQSPVAASPATTSSSPTLGVVPVPVVTGVDASPVAISPNPTGIDLAPIAAPIVAPVIATMVADPEPTNKVSRAEEAKESTAPPVETVIAPRVADPEPTNQPILAREDPARTISNGPSAASAIRTSVTSKDPTAKAADTWASLIMGAGRHEGVALEAKLGLKKEQPVIHHYLTVHLYRRLSMLTLNWEHPRTLLLVSLASW
ncbi:unnamed protein product [Arabis nemorensis]|uniref:Uncharacterized protein n=1 Tax=Arabis nemorensis TaxID=586526 RepID=A0A565CTB7_9BRAS|nr:unnamed protein product [Arabis nemorensis]